MANPIKDLNVPQMPEPVKNFFEQQTPNVEKDLTELRELIFEVASKNQTIGQIEETLKWGQPAYVTKNPKTGTTLRLATDKQAKHGSIFVHCQSKVADQIQQVYSDEFEIVSNRAIRPVAGVAETKEELRHVISMILTYHLRKS